MGAVTTAATAFAVVGWLTRPAFPGYWGVIVLALIAYLLDASSTRLRGGGAEGSLAFVFHLAAMLLFGPLWGAAVAGSSTLLGQVIGGRPANRLVFNTAQKVVAVLLASWAYLAAGGSFPPEIVVPRVSVDFDTGIRDILALLVAAGTFFVTNSVLVSGAVAISTGKPFGAVWKTNTLWVLGYDLAASVLSLFVAWLYLIFDNPAGLSRLGFLAVLAPIILIKHAYVKLNTLQQLYDELDDAHARLEQNVREQLEVMVRSIEARDPYTSGHSRRVAAVSRAIAADFGLGSDLVGEVENAALLHDVGKIHAEFAPLLQKEGKLTSEEWDLMKTHAARSAELVGLFSRFRGHVQDAVRHHHERWDGLGYPDGIRGEAIPLGARIIMVADTIDAMTTDRPYRKALGFEVVVSELQKHRGTQFDPRLVDCVMTSVSVRRMIGQPNLGLAESVASAGAQAAGPLRSHGSFFLGRRSD